MLPLRITTALLLLATLSACANPVRGILYQNITVPLTNDMQLTPLATNAAAGNTSTYRLQEPVSGANISVEWNSVALADAMRQGELYTAHAADIRIESLVLGIWRRDTLIVSGVKEAAKNNNAPDPAE